MLALFLTLSALVFYWLSRDAWKDDNKDDWHNP